MTNRALVITILLITVCLFITSGTIYAKLEDGLISAWTFDNGTAKDFQGDNDGKIIGGVEAVNGKFEKALSFNGTDGYIQVPHSKSMDIIANSFTFAAWIKPNAGVNGNSGIVTKGKGTGWGIPYAFKITLDWWGVSNANTEGYFNASGALNKPDTWVLACLTADGKQAIGYSAIEGGKVEIKAGGEGDPKLIDAPYRTDPDFPIEIGVGRLADGTTDRYFNGIIDEVYFWDRAISKDEVTQLLNGDRPKLSAPVELYGKLIALWGALKGQER